MQRIGINTIDLQMCGRMPLAAVYVNNPEEGSGHHDTFPAGHTYDDFFPILNGMEGEVSLDYDHSMPDEVSFWYLLVRGVMLLPAIK